jgi:hypothetical protein
MRLLLASFCTLFTLEILACQIHQDTSRPCHPQLHQYQAELIESTYQQSVLCTEGRFLQEARDEYEKLSANQPQSHRTILGKKIRGKKDDLFYLHQMLSGSGRVPQKARDAIAQCSEVICVLEKTLGDRESAYRALNVSYISSYRPALMQRTETDYLWSKKELRDLNYSVNLMPQSLLKSQTLGNIYTLPDGFGLNDSPNASGWATMGEAKTGEITFRDHIRRNDNWGVHVMIHEMAHHHDFKNYTKSSYKTTTGMSIGYHRVNGWRVTGKKTKTIGGYTYEEDVWEYDKENACFIRNYASTSHKEDFAEAITYYITEGERLKNTCPKVYNFMRDRVFAGKEYKKPSYGQIVENYINAHKDELKKCLSTNAKHISYHSNAPTFQNSNFKLSAADHCAKNAAEVLAQTIDQDGGSCSMRTVPHDLEKIVSSQLVTQFRPQIEREIDNILAKDNLLNFQQQCWDKKDLTDHCVTEKMNQQYRDLGYQGELAENIYVGGQLAQIGLDKLNLTSNELLDGCVEKSGLNLINLLNNMKSMSLLCSEAALSRLDQQGYQYERVFIIQMRKLMDDSEMGKTLAYVKDDILKKKRSQFKGSCLAATKSCVLKGLRKQMEQDLKPKDGPYPESLIEAIYKAFDYKLN